MVAAGEDPAEGEDDEEEEGGAQRETEGRPEGIGVRRRDVVALHHLLCCLLLISTLVLGLTSPSVVC